MQRTNRSYVVLQQRRAESIGDYLNGILYLEGMGNCITLTIKLRRHGEFKTFRCGAALGQDNGWNGSRKRAADLIFNSEG